MSVVKATFAHDTEEALQSAAALVNTEGPPDALPDVEALNAFVSRWRWTGSRRGDDEELAGVRALRPLLRRLWTPRDGATAEGLAEGGGDAGEEDAVELVNELLASRRALPQLVRHDGWAWHLHATPPDAPLADRMAVEAAMAFVDVIRQGELGRLRTCGADDCDDVLVDLSRNSSKRYCSTTCANRVNVAAFRSRSRSRPRSPGG